jgi:hypothetical protein
MVVLFKLGLVGRGRQVSRITDRLSSNKWKTGHLGVRWKVTVEKIYGRMTWWLGIGGKSCNKGLSMSERGKETDNSYGM